MDDELLWTPAWRLRELIGAGELSPVELLELVLARLDRVEPAIHAFVTVAPELALDQARRAAEAVARGDELGPLHGIPVSVKDTIDTADMRTTVGSLLFADRRPARDAVLVERLRAAGAVVFGKTNTPEFAASVRTVNLLGPETLNPWDLTRSPGASSGGAAAAVAAGVGPLAIGTDGGGSTRLPAALTGIVGVYPSRGRVPGFSDLLAIATSGAGPLARDVRDAAVVLEVISGESGLDPATAAYPAAPDLTGDLDRGVDGLRLAWSGDFGRVRVADQRVLDTVHATAALLGHVEEPDLHLPDVFDTLALERDYTLAAMARLPVRPGPKGFAELLAELRADPEAWSKLSPQMQVHDAVFLDYVLSIPPSVRYRPVDRPEDVLERYDALLSPTISRIAFRCEDGIDVPSWTEYTYIANAAGMPAASVPAGFVHGMPVGLQILGRAGDEATVLRVARAVEQAAPWHAARPPC